MNDTFRHESQSLGGLKSRTRRILTHNATVQQGFPYILTQQQVTLGTLTTNHHTRIIAGRADHTEHFARRGFDSHNTTYLSFHQSFAQGLQIGIKA